MGFESLTGSEGDGWKSPGWELTPDSLRADGPSVSRAKPSLHRLSPLGLPHDCGSQFLCLHGCIPRHGQQVAVLHATVLKDPTAGRVSCPHSGLTSPVREHMVPRVEVTSHQGPTESKAGRAESREPEGASPVGIGHCPLLFQTLSHHWGCSASTGHIHSLESWAPGSLLSEYLVPSSWAWACEGPSLDSNQGDLSSGCREGHELPTGPDSVIFTVGIPETGVSDLGRWRVGLLCENVWRGV